MANVQAGLAGGAVALAVAGLGVWTIWGRTDQGEPARPAPVAVAATALAPEGNPDLAPDIAVPPEPPRFDVVRVDGGGFATIAGTVAPGGLVSIRVDGVEVVQAKADTGGQFATLLTLTPSDAARVLSLVLLTENGEVPGVETVVLAPFAAPVVADVVAAPDEIVEAKTDTAEGEAVVAKPADAVEVPATEAPVVAELAVVELAPPAALLISPDSVKILQQPAPVADMPAPKVQIDTIAYGAQEDVLIGGRAGMSSAVRLYLDGAVVAEVITDAAGKWDVVLPEVPVGLHQLRADQVDETGKVVARYETPFKREQPVVEVAQPLAPVAAALETLPKPAPAPIRVTVQPGLTLWEIARDNFGEGVMYVQVFEANRDKIKDPDLIYPGQVVTVPVQ